MKTITIWEKAITLDIWEDITVKELRKIYPVLNKYGDNEIEMIIQVCIALWGDEEVLDSLTTEEFKSLSETVAGFIETKKK